VWCHSLHESGHTGIVSCVASFRQMKEPNCEFYFPAIKSHVKQCSRCVQIEYLAHRCDWKKLSCEFWDKFRRELWRAIGDVDEKRKKREIRWFPKNSTFFQNVYIPTTTPEVFLEIKCQNDACNAIGFLALRENKPKISRSGRSRAIQFSTHRHLFFDIRNGIFQRVST
jgi:hypothetical protein